MCHVLLSAVVVGLVWGHGLSSEVGVLIDKIIGDWW